MTKIIRLVGTRKFLLFVCLGLFVLAIFHYSFIRNNSGSILKSYDSRKSHFSERFTKWSAHVDVAEFKTKHTKLIITTNINDNKIHESWKTVTLHSDPKKCEAIDKHKDFERTIKAAVESGTRYIFISSKCNQLTNHYLERFNYDDTMSILNYTGTSTNPISNHFVTVDIHDSYKKRTPEEISYNLGVWKTPLIQKILFRNEITKAGDIDFRSPPFLLPSNSERVLIKDMILFQYGAYWALAPFANDAMWTAWVQRLLQELHSQIALITASLSKHQCYKSNSKFDSKKLLTWKCEKNNQTFFNCIHLLNAFMVKHKLMNASQEQKVSEWLKMLTAVGYVEPKLLASENYPQKSVYRTLYHPKIEHFTMKDGYNSICGKTQPTCPDPTIKKLESKVSTILVNLVFNNERFYDIVNYLENIYRPHISHLLFCGPVMKNFLAFYNQLKTPISFIEMDSKEFQLGQYGYRCIEGAMKMNYDIDGVMHLNDDVLLNIWNIPKLPTDRVWFQKKLSMTPFSQPSVPDVWEKRAKDGGKWWPWTKKGMGKSKLQPAMESVRNLSRLHPLAKAFIDQVDKNTNNISMGFHGVSDIAYFPQKTFKRFLYVSEVFGPYTVFLELQVPSLIGGLTNLKDIVRLDGRYIWFDERKDYAKYYNTSHIFLHSLKILGCLKDTACKKFLCDRHLPCY